MSKLSQNFTSSLPQRTCSSMWSSLDWVRNSLQAKERKQDSEEAVKEAREKAKESGIANVFEYDDIAPSASAPGVSAQSVKPGKVCDMSSNSSSSSDSRYLLLPFVHSMTAGHVSFIFRTAS